MAGCNKNTPEYVGTFVPMEIVEKVERLAEEMAEKGFIGILCRGEELTFNTWLGISVTFKPICGGMFRMGRTHKDSRKSRKRGGL